MDTFVVEAIYQDGVIKPLTDLPLSENERLKVHVERLASSAGNGHHRTIQLRGIWKRYLTQPEKESDWVSETILDLRKISTSKLSTLREEIDDATRRAGR